VLDHMHQQGDLTDLGYAEAVAQELVFKSAIDDQD